MIAADTSSLIAFLGGEEGADTDAVGHALSGQFLLLPPPVVAEIVSDPELDPDIRRKIAKIPQLEILPGYWERAGELRARLYKLKNRPKMLDALIAQSCIDHKVPLVTRDSDFQSMTLPGGLQLL